jgi:hypothetical protein
VKNYLGSVLMVEKQVDDEPLWRKSKKTKGDFKKFFSILAILIIMIIVIITVFVLALPPETKTIFSDLKVDGIQVKRVNDEYVEENTTSTDLEVIIYLTNDGELDSGNIKIDGYIRSFDTRGVETPCNSNDTTSYGPVETDSTGKTTLNFDGLIIKHDEKYTIDFYIWEDDKVVEKASTTIKVPYIEVKEDPDVDYSDDANKDEPGRSKKEDSEDGFYATPGFEAIYVIAVLLILGLLIRSKRTRIR